MNFLAHIYLSGNSDSIKVGNFIADAVKGKKYLEYPLDIQKGIQLHRKIDTFTDTHPTVRISKKRLHQRYGHYDGVIVDILYDHFLAKNWKSYSDTPLDHYVENFYVLLKRQVQLPEKIKHLMPYMIRDNWLYNYRSLEGIERVLKGMNRRTKNKSQMHLAIHDLRLHYEEFENDFMLFFENLRTFCNEKIQSL